VCESKVFIIGFSFVCRLLWEKQELKDRRFVIDYSNSQSMMIKLKQTESLLKSIAPIGPSRPQPQPTE